MHWLVFQVMLRKMPVPGLALPPLGSCWEHSEEEGTGAREPRGAAAASGQEEPSKRLASGIPSVAEGIPALGAHLPPWGPAWHGWELCLGGCGINYATLQTSGMSGDQLVGGVRVEEGQMRSEQTCGCRKIADPLARKKCF